MREILCLSEVTGGSCVGGGETGEDLGAIDNRELSVEGNVPRRNRSGYVRISP